VTARHIGAVFAALALIGAASPEAPLDPAANRIRADVQFLASDELEGRDTGSTGYRIAAQYVASQFAANGLKPGGVNGGWFQEVPFRRAKHVGEPKIALVVNGRSVPLAFGKDISVRPSLTEQRRMIDAGMVFAGYGINDPVLRINDYAGLDARGKIAVVMAGPPRACRAKWRRICNRPKRRWLGPPVQLDLFRFRPRLTVLLGFNLLRGRNWTG
jgi:hypothetical protein